MTEITPLDIDFDTALRMPIPEGLTPAQEEEWLCLQRVPVQIATSVVHSRHPDDWPPPGVDFASGSR